MITKWKLAAVAVASALAAGAAGAAGSTGSSEPNPGMGVLGGPPQSTTRTSVFTVDESEFMRLDADRDGKLSRAELTGMTELHEDWLRVDLDSDGYLSREELARFHAAGGTRIASDETKVPAADTTADAQGATGGRQSADRADRPSRTLGMDGTTPSPDTAPAQTQPDLMILVIDEPEFVRLDKDGDRRLSRDEVAAVDRLQQSWGAMDGNGDGYVTRDELTSYQRSLGQSGRQAPR